MTTGVGERRASKFRSDIQGLRAIAVALVVIYHAGVPFIPGGYVGVDVFFVISGFLITTHLVQGLERHGRVRFAEFYARRIRRIIPASFVVAALTVVAAIVIVPPLRLATVLKDAIATFTYVPNVWFAVQGTDYLADQSPSPFQHYWSLGVEEQFYLVWPLFIAIAFWACRKSYGRVVAVVAVVVLVSLAACIYLTFSWQPVAFFMLPTRAWELGVGGLIAFLVLWQRRAVPPRVASIGSWVGLAVLLASGLFFHADTIFPGYAAIVPVAGTAAVIYFGAYRTRGGAEVVLGLGFMQFLGLISYSLYLVHWPLLILPQAAVGDEKLPLVATVGLALLAVPLAYLLYRFVEDPLRSQPWLTRSRPRATLWSALGLTGVLAAVLVGVIAITSSMPLASDKTAEAAVAPSSPPLETTFIPSNMTPTLRNVESDLPSLYDSGCHRSLRDSSVQDCVFGAEDSERTIALFGDSHAAQWFPALEKIATESGARLEVYTKSSCPAAQVTVINAANPYTGCDEWRSAVMKRLVEEKVSEVLVAEFGNPQIVGTAPADRVTALSNGLAATVGTLTAAGSHVTVLADTPHFSESPNFCLSQNLDDVTPCVSNRAVAIDTMLIDAERPAVQAAGGEYIDLNDYICASSTCPLVVSNILVYRDVNHLTATYAAFLSPVLGQKLGF